MVKSRAAAPRRANAQRTTGRPDGTQRIAEMIDLAAGAKMIADNLGERFLSYLLAMVIQEMSHVDSKRASKSTTAGNNPGSTAQPTRPSEAPE